MIATFAIGALGIVGYVLAIASDAPNLTQLSPRIPGNEETKIYASNDSLLATIGSDVLRTPLTRKQEPKLIREATVAIEDRRFWQHGGVDYQGLLRAAVKDLFEGGGIQGGSTLTMQLVTNIYLPEKDKTQHNIKYKIIQAKLANELQSKYSRESILTQYLNDVPYGTVNGQSAIGISARHTCSSISRCRTSTWRSTHYWQACLRRRPPTTPSTTRPAPPSGARRCCRRWRTRTTSPRRRPTPPTPSRCRSFNDSSYSKVNQPYVVNYVEQQLLNDLGDRVVDKGGLKGLHNDQPRRPGHRRNGDQDS